MLKLVYPLHVSASSIMQNGIKPVFCSAFPDGTLYAGELEIDSIFNVTTGFRSSYEQVIL